MIRMYICMCNAITDRLVQEAVSQGAADLSDLQAQLGVATCCGLCADTAKEYLPGGRHAAQTKAMSAQAMTGLPETTHLGATEIRRVA